jgi:lambda family phage portal protein
MVTQSRDMDRNDWAFGQMVNRAVNNAIKSGIKPDPDTGDKGLDTEIRERFKEWAETPNECDVTGRQTFYKMQKMAMRACIVDGDIFALPLANGKLQWKESHEVHSPNQNQHDAIVLGVELDLVNRPIRYYFQKQRTEDRKRTGYRFRRSKSDYQVVNAFNEDGSRSVLHLYEPDRFSNSRGVPWIKSIFDISSMLEDSVHAKLVQNQVMSCIAMFIETTDPNYSLGKRRQETDQDGDLRHVDTLEPGKILKLRPNEKVQGFSPNIASSDWFDFIKLLLRIFGAQIGLPLSLALMDTSDTVFHGYRAEMEQAKIGFESFQTLINDSINAPIYQWKLWDWFPRRFSNDRERRKLLRHKWQNPGWNYLDPEKDAKADAVKLENGLSSPRRVVAKQGHDWEQLVDETVKDREYAIRKALDASKAIEEEYGETVHWREILHLAAPSGVSVSIMTGNEPQLEQKKDDSEEKDENDNDDQSTG